MIKKLFTINFDLIGAITAMICAVHCAIFPLFLSFGLITSSSHNHTFDWIMMTMGIMIAGYVLVVDFISKHRNPGPILSVVVGFITLFFGIQTHGDFFILNVIGGMLITFSHFLNWKLSHSRPFAKN